MRAGTLRLAPHFERIAREFNAGMASAITELAAGVERAVKRQRPVRAPSAICDAYVESLDERWHVDFGRAGRGKSTLRSGYRTGADQLDAYRYMMSEHANCRGDLLPDAGPIGDLSREVEAVCQLAR